MMPAGVLVGRVVEQLAIKHGECVRHKVSGELFRVTMSPRTGRWKRGPLIRLVKLHPTDERAWPLEAWGKWRKVRDYESFAG
jgi:hypothetical protein